jgi:anti-sigma regulatory factor (Ser/Thr protein kinase)
MTPHLWPLRSYLELGALPTAVPCARLHARQLVWEWGLNGLAANTELLVSELVTNAVKTTAGNNDQAAICLQLSGDNTRVLIEVWDADPQPPVLKDLGEDGTPDPQEEGGRGLCLIAALSTRWAWYLTEKPTGKVVWCELTAEPPELSESARSAPQALLPRRVPREQQKQPIEVMRDPDILRRLADRLRDLGLAGLRSGADPPAQPGKATPAAEVSRAGPLQRIGNWQFRIPRPTSPQNSPTSISPGRLHTHLVSRRHSCHRQLLLHVHGQGEDTGHW